MIIELYGLPGSGKSTFARELAQRSSATIVRIESRTELILLNIFFLSRYPIRSIILLWYIVRFGLQRPLFYMKFMNLFLQPNAKFIKAKRRKGISIIDQGHFQNVISLFEKPVSTELLQGYIKHFPKTDKLILFDIPEHVRKKNMEKRGYGVRENISEAIRSRWIRASTHNHQALLPWVSHSMRASCILQTLEESHDFIEGFIEHLKKEA